jgi:flavin reductase (DIM6/NTAB) family NADH-FMN oxidoreductase RutF
VVKCPYPSELAGSPSLSGPLHNLEGTSPMSRIAAGRKVEISPAKSSWHPSPLLGQVVLISSRNTRGEIHVAAKSWISMAAANPPVLVLSCRISHRTAINILETREFVVNIPGDDISERVWKAGERLDQLAGENGSGWTYSPALKVSAPLIKECKAHLECVLHATNRLNSEEIVLFGQIEAVSLDESLMKGTAEDRYKQLRPLLFLEEGLYGTLEAPHRLAT